MIGIPLGIAYTCAAEWLIHKHILHGIGKKKSSFWSFHFHDHHKSARKADMLDEAYQRPVLEDLNSPQTKELLSLIALGAIHIPLAPVAPFFVGTVLYHAAKYYRVHKRSHLDPQWAKEHLPWHYDHHMGKDQDQNWGVTYPYFDQLMGTRKKYVGTPEYEADQQRKRSRPSPKGSPIIDESAHQNPTAQNEPSAPHAAAA